MLREPHGRRMRGQIVEAQHRARVEREPQHTLTDRKVADPAHRLGVDSGMHERRQGAIIGAHGERAVPRPGQFHRRGDDAAQRGVEV